MGRRARRRRLPRRSWTGCCATTSAAPARCTRPSASPRPPGIPSGSSARTSTTRARTRSTTRSARPCSPSAWARRASSPRRARASTASPAPPRARCSASSASSTWARRTSAARCPTSSAWACSARRSSPSSPARARSRRPSAPPSATGSPTSRTRTTSSARPSARRRSRRSSATSSASSATRRARRSSSATGRLPERVIACVGGGSNAIGIFAPFYADADVELIGVEAAGEGVETPRHGAPLTVGGRGGVLHGSFSAIMQDEDGQILEAHSICAGLDYPGVGPEHAWLRDSGRARYVAVTDARGARRLPADRRAGGHHPGARVLPRARLGRSPTDHPSSTSSASAGAGTRTWPRSSRSERPDRGRLRAATASGRR